jgi:hypothetical protein
MGQWPEEVFYSWIRIGICREIMNRPLNEVADAFLQAHEARPNRAEALYHLSCVYRKYNRPRNAFLISSQALTLPLQNDDILFVDHSVYQWGILDEIATTAFYVGKIHMGLAACEKLLAEPYLPDEHRERIKNNRTVYLKAIEEMQKQQLGPAIEKQQQVEENVKKIVNQTTFSKPLTDLQAVKL